MRGYWQLSDRVVLVKVNGSPCNISIIIVYAPTGESTEEELEEFYECLENAKARDVNKWFNLGVVEGQNSNYD